MNQSVAILFYELFYCYITISDLVYKMKIAALPGAAVSRWYWDHSEFYGSGMLVRYNKILRIAAHYVSICAALA